jgi:hypothetical protein
MGSFSKIRKNVVWAPQDGGQVRAITCPVWEMLVHGNRGGGKTDWLLMDFAQGIGKGYGADYRGLLLREATTELGDVIAKANKWFPRMFPGAKYNESTKRWKFPDGETLWFNYARVMADYDQYHGHEYPWIGWEELTNHAIPDIYLKLMSCNRCSNERVPKKYRGTCNPSGPGHAWVKERFIDSVLEGRVLREEMDLSYTDKYGVDHVEKQIITRTHIFVDLMDNKKLLDADPLYRAKMKQMTQDNEMLEKAWIRGSWDLIIGGFFTDVWRPKTHIIKPFQIPKSWTCVRSFDWGSSKPWCVTFFVEANGEQPQDMSIDFPYIPKGTVIVINEIYGWTGKVNDGDRADSSEIVRRIKEVEETIKIEYGLTVEPGPADTSIYDVKDGTSIGMTMAKYPLNCFWLRAHKGSGSRVAGWSLMRGMLGAAIRRDTESPHLYFFAQAYHHIRTLPLMQRDIKKPEDIDSSLEDHCFVYDTKIITDQGIEKIGDLVGSEGKVLSINGEFVPFRNCRLVKKNVKIIKITFSDGYSVHCTEDHKFLTTIGFIEGKDLLTLSDIQCIVSKINSNNGELSCSKEKSLLYQKQNKDSMESITTNVENTFRTKEEDFTELFGNITTEKYLKDFMYTTKKKTQERIRLMILKLKKSSSIYQIIPKDTQDLQLKTALMLQENGIKVMKEKNGIVNTMKIPNITFIKILKGFVRNVVKSVRARENFQQLSVPIVASLSLEGNQELTMLKESVQYVPLHFQSTDIQQLNVVHVNAEQNYVLSPVKIEPVEENQDVYCLVAEGTHTFALENGLIVSNCMDSLRYGISRKMMAMSHGKVGM